MNRLATIGAQDISYKARLRLAQEGRSESGKICKGELYGHEYRVLTATREEYPRMGRVKLKLARDADLISGLDLALHNPERRPLNDLLSSIVVEIGGQRIDALGGPDGDFEAHLHLLCAWYRQEVTQVGEWTVVPLLLGPFNRDVLLPMMALQYHEVSLWLHFACSLADVQVWGGTYYMEAGERRECLARVCREITVLQTQFTGRETLQPVVAGEDKENVFTYRCNFNHPCLMLAFHGFDKARVSRVLLRHNCKVVMDNSIELLEYYKAKRGMGDLDHVCVFFADDDTQAAAWNFSRMDKLELQVVSSQDTPVDLHVYAINKQHLRVASGMAGLEYSK